MPKGTAYTIKCPKCRRGCWSFPPQRKGVERTGRVEGKLSRSAHKGHGSGGPTWTGYRGEVRCLDCGHAWFSKHPDSGRRDYRSVSTALRARPTD